MNCTVCHGPVDPRRHSQYCSEKCKNARWNEKMRGVYAEKKGKPTVRRCADCQVELSTPTAIRCDPHKYARMRQKQRVYSENHRIKTGVKVVAPKQPKAKDTSVAGRIRSGELTSATESPPWFEGWNGCYSPTLSPLQVSLLESGRGRPTVDTQHQTMVVTGRDKVEVRKAG